ncbi:regulatory subunit for Cdc7p protein kinase [Pseudohyphozyma bogoriensis]|nr:regulatory subunit for Cdc7p protein kinase [Pseudohyphozyma bogoriensis]
MTSIARTPTLAQRQPTTSNISRVRSRRDSVQHQPEASTSRQPIQFTHAPTPPTILTASNARERVTERELAQFVAAAAPVTSHNAHGKRPAPGDEVLDLTLTTGGSPSALPQPKKAKQSGGLPVAAAPAMAMRAGAGSNKVTQAKREKLEAESAEWRAKYKKAFPTFVFYFDFLDGATEYSLSARVRSLGAKIEPFFSKKVTHVVTSRAAPTSNNNNKENVLSPSIVLGSAKGKKVPSLPQPQPKKSPRSYVAMTGERLRQHDENNPFFDSQDILSKAADMGLKVWRLDKIQNILDRLASISPSKNSSASRRKLSLPTLLREEQHFGTRERDPFVLRADTHYFREKNYYILVEDTTGLHRPIVTKEYERPPKGHDPPWPVLWGGVEGRTGFYHYEGPPIKYERRAPPPPQQTRATKPQGPGYGVAARAVNAAAPNLRRAASMNRITKTAGGRNTANGGGQVDGGRGSYIAASGNSQIITSNIASATSTRSGAPMHANPNGALRAKQIEMLNRNSVSFDANGQLAPGKLKRSVSVDAGLNARAPPAREEPKKPGYCENCRIKYDDFKDHVESRKHKKFARNLDNWIELDALLSTITRPILEEEEEEEMEEEMEEDGESSSPTSSQLEAGAGDDSGFFENGCDPCGSHEEDEIIDGDVCVDY